MLKDGFPGPFASSDGLARITVWGTGGEAGLYFSDEEGLKQQEFQLRSTSSPCMILSPITHSLKGYPLFFSCAETQRLSHLLELLGDRRHGEANLDISF